MAFGDGNMRHLAPAVGEFDGEPRRGEPHLGADDALDPAGGGANRGIGMPGFAEISGRDRVTVQAEGDAVFEVELAFQRARRDAALAAGDLLGE